MNRNMFACRLKQLRESNKLTQEELANKLGISRGSISYYEKRERFPDINVLFKVCEYFNVSADWILGLSNDNKTLCLNKAHSNFIQSRFNRRY